MLISNFSYAEGTRVRGWSVWFVRMNLIRKYNLNIQIKYKSSWSVWFVRTNLIRMAHTDQLEWMAFSPIHLKCWVHLASPSKSCEDQQLTKAPIKTMITPPISIFIKQVINSYHNFSQQFCFKTFSYISIANKTKNLQQVQSLFKFQKEFVKFKVTQLNLSCAIC